jgi:predicted trehalose synthase
MRTIAAFALLFILGCTTSTTSVPATQQAGAQSQHKNLQILPQDISRDELIAIMRTFTRSLGVRCNHCHVVTATEPKEVLDFPSDAKEEKRVARVMMQMTANINRTWLPRVEVAEGHPMPAANQIEDQVSCWTCHRGKTEPDPMPPAETTSK